MENHPNRINWIKTSVSLYYLNQALTDFVTDKLNDIRVKIDGVVGQTRKCSNCKGESVKIDDKFPQMFRRCKISCTVCSKWLDAIQNECLQTPHNSKVVWKYTDPKRWPTDNWELVKAFLPPGNQASTSPSECDVTALLTLVLNCKFLRQCFGNRKLLKQVKDHRNKIMHSNNMAIDKSDAIAYMNDMIGLLEDPLHMKNKPASTEARLNIEEIRDSEFDLLPRKEFLEGKAFQQLFEDRIQLLQAQIENLPKKLQVEVTSLRKQVHNNEMEREKMTATLESMQVEMQRLKDSTNSHNDTIGNISIFIEEFTATIETIFREDGPLVSFVEKTRRKYFPGDLLNKALAKVQGIFEDRDCGQQICEATSGPNSTNLAKPEHGDSNEKGLINNEVKGVVEIEGLPALGTRVAMYKHTVLAYGSVTGHVPDGGLLVTWDEQEGDSEPEKVADHDVSAVKVPRVLEKELVAVGCRVKRGTGWRYDNQDGGNGNCGTVIHVSLGGIVTVRWDCGGFYNYRFIDHSDVEIVEDYVLDKLDGTVHKGESCNENDVQEEDTTEQLRPEAETSDDTEQKPDEEQKEQESDRAVYIDNQATDVVELEGLPVLGTRATKSGDDVQKHGTVVAHVSKETSRD